jgi:hypothetical protein
MWLASKLAVAAQMQAGAVNDIETAMKPVRLAIALSQVILLFLALCLAIGWYPFSVILTPPMFICAFLMPIIVIDFRQSMQMWLPLKVTFFTYLIVDLVTVILLVGMYWTPQIVVDLYSLILKHTIFQQKSLEIFEAVQGRSIEDADYFLGALVIAYVGPIWISCMLGAVSFCIPFSPIVSNIPERWLARKAAMYFCIGIVVFFSILAAHIWRDFIQLAVPWPKSTNGNLFLSDLKSVNWGHLFWYYVNVYLMFFCSVFGATNLFVYLARNEEG